MADQNWGEYVFETVAHNTEHIELLEGMLASDPEAAGFQMNREGFQNIVNLLKRNTKVIQKFDDSIIEEEQDGEPS